jgi:spermidine synthase
MIRRRVPHVLFVLSGMAGLVLEAVLLRQLAWIFGSTAVAASIVLAAFMGGLALGAAWFGRWADRHPRPLGLFGMLEIGTACAAAGLVWLLGSGRPFFLAPLRVLEPGPFERLAELTLAFVLVLVPTVLMGGTLPAISRAVIDRMDRFVGSLGMLYGLNTLGAAAGVFLAGFFLIEWLGVSGSAYAAAAVHLVVGLTAVALARTGGADGPALPRAGPPAPDAHAPRAVARACGAAAFLGGFAMLGYEVVWTRLLSLPLRSFSYSFSLMLSLFLLGLCIGAVALGLTGRFVRRPALWVGWLQIAMGAYVASSVLWLPSRLAPVPAESFEEFLLRAALRAAPVVLPPTVLSGMVLPLAARGIAGGERRIGGDVGRAYGLNTAGAIAGALAAGLVLLPALGAALSLAALAAFQAAGGAAVLGLSFRRPAVRVAAALAALACAAPLGADRERFVTAFLEATRSEKIGDLLFFHEGASDTVAVVRRDYGFRDRGAKSLITNGVLMSATVKPVWRYMALEGHLPVLLAAGRERALAVGVGTGITLGAVVSHPEIERIDAVELSEGVIRALEHFRDENGGAHGDPRVRLVREDGRHWLELNPESYDVITLEPPPPIVAGSVHLYSLDFYELCLRRLKAGGVVAQWLPLHAQSLASARMTARTFLDAFPWVTLWLPSARDAVLVGSREPPRLSLERLRGTFAEPRTRENFERAWLETPEALLGTFLLDRSGVERWAAGAPTITDERPWMEFFRHQGGNMSDGDIATLLDVPPGDLDWIDGLAEAPQTAARVRDERRALRAYVQSHVTGDDRLGLAAAALSRETEFFLSRYGCAREQVEALRAEVGEAELRGHVERCSLIAAGQIQGK